VRERFSSILLFLIFVSTAAAGASAEARPPGPITTESIQGVLHQLMGDDIKAFTGFMPSIEIKKDVFPNAFARGETTIVLTTGLLRQIASEDELAFVLAHEIAHLMKHSGQSSEHTLFPQRSKLKSALELEYEADVFAVQLLKRAGFSPLAGAGILERNGHFGSEFGSPLFATHPSLLARLERLRAHN